MQTKGVNMKIITPIIGLLCVVWLSGCGQKGDLYPSAEVPPPAMEKAETKAKPAE